MRTEGRFGCWWYLLVSTTFVPGLHDAIGTSRNDSVSVLKFLSGRWNSSLRKCCPNGQVLVDEPFALGCIQVPPRASELYELEFGDLGNFPETGGAAHFSKFPCKNLLIEDTKIVPASDLHPTNSPQAPTCIEIRYNETSEESYPIVAYCETSEAKQATRLPSHGPKVLPIRRCCPRKKIFDATVRACVPIPERLLSMAKHFENEGLLSLLPEAIRTMSFLMIERGLPKCDTTIYDYRIDTANMLFDNQSLLVALSLDGAGDAPGERMSLTAEDSCLELLLDEEEQLISHAAMSANAKFESADPSLQRRAHIMVRVCKTPEICQRQRCLRKCCSEGEFLHIEGGCQRLGDSDDVLGFHQALSSRMLPDSSSSNYGILIGIPCQYGMYPLLPHEGNWSLTSEGHVHSADYHVYHQEEYCMEIVQNSSDYEDTLYPFICFDSPAYEDDPSPERYHFNTTLQAISCTFLLVTLLIYACLPALQNLHGKTLMCHVASLILAYICLIAVPWVTPNSFYWTLIHSEDEANATAACSVVGYTMLFAFLSAFSWLNVMCFDIWWTFGSLRGRSTRSRSHRKKFFVYCSYAWGISILVTGMAILADETTLVPSHLRPNINLMSCWFPKLPDFYGEMIFFVGPILIQLISNATFFVLTTIHCNRVKDEIRRMAMDPADPRNKTFHADKTKLLMNVKLFIVMGVSWVAEIASILINKYARRFKWREELFYVADSFNCLQGLLIFVLFALKTRVYQALRKRFGWDKKRNQFAASQAMAALQDPYRMKQSASSSTLTSTFALTTTT